MKNAGARFAPCVDFDFGGSAWRALPQLDALWLEQRWLGVADAHFGKAATFRCTGPVVSSALANASVASCTAVHAVSDVAVSTPAAVP